MGFSRENTKLLLRNIPESISYLILKDFENLSDNEVKEIFEILINESIDDLKGIKGKNEMEIKKNYDRVKKSYERFIKVFDINKRKK